MSIIDDGFALSAFVSTRAYPAAIVPPVRLDELER
jgi:hypothetical protein